MNIFLEETVSEAVEKLRQLSFRVDYKQMPQDPEHHNGYVVPHDNPGQILAVISSVIRWRRVMPDWDLPDNANSCVQISSTLLPETNRLIETIYHSLTTVKNDKGEDNETN